MKTDFGVTAISHTIHGTPMMKERKVRPGKVVVEFRNGREISKFAVFPDEVLDLARWFAATGRGITQYPVRIDDYTYEIMESLGDPPEELLAEDREADLEAWQERREHELLTVGLG